jgi:hypothetical protein
MMAVLDWNENIERETKEDASGKRRVTTPKTFNWMEEVLRDYYSGGIHLVTFFKEATSTLLAGCDFNCGRRYCLGTH